MFFLKKIFQKNLNIDEIEDLLFDNGVEPKFADLIVSKIKENKSQEEDIKKVIKDELLTKFKEKKFMNNSRKVNFGNPKLEVFHQNDGSIIIKNIISPDEWPSNIILKLIHWSTKTPEIIFLAQRNHSNLWEKISYIETLKKVKSIAYFLLNHRLSEKRPLLILSRNLLPE